mmetsp:Transcript_30066/g.69359  ORF Transcript_30066/g.69359 Transcript_30066/m.69359 type:complete len:156 (+) Transcript_30066:740-1207(+)
MTLTLLILHNFENKAENATVNPIDNSHGMILQAKSRVGFGVGSCRLIGMIVHAIERDPMHSKNKNVGWAKRTDTLFLDFHVHTIHEREDRINTPQSTRPAHKTPGVMRCIFTFLSGGSTSGELVVPSGYTKGVIIRTGGSARKSTTADDTPRKFT